MKTQLIEKISRAESNLCIGVDPHIDGLPKFMQHIIANKGELYFLEWFGEQLIEVAAEKKVACLKFQSAFFESYGHTGHQVLENLIRKCRDRSILSILDAKRGDISSTMKAYGSAAFDHMDADILTITPYMGTDVIKPLVPWLSEGKGVYVVWVSSNPSGGDIQELACSDGHTVAEELFDKIENFASQNKVSDSIGYVLGATKVDQLSDQLFAKVKQKPLLMPGIGAQGASRNDPKIRELTTMGHHLLPVSRGISGYGSQYLDPGLDGVTEDGYLSFLGTKVDQFSEG